MAVAVARPRPAACRVTVLVVSFNDRVNVNRCLRRVREHTAEVVEIVVVDSGSTDGTAEFVAHHLGPATGVVLGRNVGFGAAANLGVLRASTEYVCLLNADVDVDDHWLTPLVEVLDTRPDTAAVAPVLLHPDGSVQEAGSLLVQDGSTRAWAGSVPLPTPGRVRPGSADYVSGACLLVRRSAFTAVGGFSSRYDTAYYEDADLAQLFARQGWTVRIEPSSTVVHHLHGSSGGDVARSLMALNVSTFRDRWPAAIQGRPPVDRDHHDQPLAALVRTWSDDERVLVVDDRVPNADRGSGDPRTDALLRTLVGAGRSVTLLARDAMRAERYAPALEALGIEVVWGQERPDDWLESRTGCFDLVIASRPVNFTWVRDAVARFQPQASRIYDAEALFHRRPLQFAEAETDEVVRRGLLEEAAALTSVERDAFEWADTAFCVTQEEAEWARSVSPTTRVSVLCHPVVPAPVVEGVDQRSGVVFFGGFMAGAGSPNELAAVELAHTVMPLLRAGLPRLPLVVAGADPTPAIVDLVDEDTMVLGRVHDPAAVLLAGRVMVVPMRFGAGIKLKVLDAMAHGLPFVTTPLGAEGLELGRWTQHLVAGSTADLVELTHRLLTDDGLWIEAQRFLLEHVARRFSAEVFRATVDEALSHVGLAPRP